MICDFLRRCRVYVQFLGSDGDVVWHFKHCGVRIAHEPKLQYSLGYRGCLIGGNPTAFKVGDQTTCCNWVGELHSTNITAWALCPQVLDVPARVIYA
jgi:hypothetical protein